MKEAIDVLKINLKKNDVVVIGESGGPDSMCLLHVVNGLKSKLNLKIIAAHVNHNVREASKDEEIFIKDYCENNEIIFESMTIQNYTDDNFHNQARKIRYNFFEEIVKKYNANFLMTAHHADDLMETILMRLVRGSSIKGYCGFESLIDKKDYKILRPLINYTKSEIEEFDKKNNIPYVVDSSNIKDKYTRNRFRNHLLPFLKSEDKNVHKKFLLFSNKLSECNNFINNYALNKMKKIYKDNILNINNFSDLEHIIRVKIIENILYSIYEDDLFVINDSHVKLILDMIESNKKNIIINLPHNIIVKKEYNKLIFNYEDFPIEDYEIELQEEVFLDNGMTIKIVDESTSSDNFCTRFVLDEIELPLYIRTKREGDKISVKKMIGTKKVKEIFIDAKTPVEKRKSWPLLVDGKGRVLWVPGLKKSKFDKEINEKYDIIIKCEK